MTDMRCGEEWQWVERQEDRQGVWGGVTMGTEAGGQTVGARDARQRVQMPVRLVAVHKRVVHKRVHRHILFHGNGLAIWHSFPDITHIKANNGLESTILNLIRLNFFRAYPSLKLLILFYSNGLAIWHSSPDISNIIFCIYFGIVVVDLCFTSLFGTKGLLSDIVIR